MNGATAQAIAGGPLLELTRIDLIDLFGSDAGLILNLISSTSREITSHTNFDDTEAGAATSSVSAAQE